VTSQNKISSYVEMLTLK